MAGISTRTESFSGISQKRPHLPLSRNSSGGIGGGIAGGIAGGQARGRTTAAQPNFDPAKKFGNDYYVLDV